MNFISLLLKIFSIFLNFAVFPEQNYIYVSIDSYIVFIFQNTIELELGNELGFFNRLEKTSRVSRGPAPLTALATVNHPKSTVFSYDSGIK